MCWKVLFSSRRWGYSKNRVKASDGDNPEAIEVLGPHSSSARAQGGHTGAPGMSSLRHPTGMGFEGMLHLAESMRVWGLSVWGHHLPASHEVKHDLQCRQSSGDSSRSSHRFPETFLEFIPRSGAVPGLITEELGLHRTEAQNTISTTA
jgi:hypothetical protein